ncbi:hypothetical protein [Kitasatospora sp. NPDC088779]
MAQKQLRTIRRLGRAALFQALRGAAYATGGALVTWLIHRT